jgi:sterol desaturase/sphingolipid hydroxylase (fatty acid hydroxylase superfamily)
MLMDLLKGLLITALIFVPLEYLLALHPKQKIFRRAWANDLIYQLVNGQIIAFMLGGLVVGIIMVAGWAIPSAVQNAVAAQPYWLQIIEIVLLSDIGFYLAHRAFHEIPILWKFHMVHHSIEELDWLAAARVHPLDQIITKGFSLLPVFSLGFSEIAIGISLMIYGWQSVLIHSNVRIKFGPFRWVFASPEFHHWHHSNDREARDKNFAGQLPFLDLMFGTLHMPRGRMPERYGIDEKLPRTYPGQLAYPFRMLRGERNIADGPEPGRDPDPMVVSHRASTQVNELRDSPT